MTSIDWKRWRNGALCAFGLHVWKRAVRSGPLSGIQRCKRCGEAKIVELRAKKLNDNTDAEAA